MMGSRGLFRWSLPHVQPLTPVSEVSEPPESPLPYMDSGVEVVPVEDKGPIEEVEEIEPPAAAVPFSWLFACADGVDWAMMMIGAMVAAAHGMALVIYLHLFGRAINLLDSLSTSLEMHKRGVLFRKFKDVQCSVLKEASQTAST